MALINKITKISRNSKVHDEVQTTYNVLMKNGKKYVQLNTYGSMERKEKGVVSQTIQLSEDVIGNLQEILKKDF
ncbi:methionyl-tRNA formyltransferase [Jeotgalibacillus sp. R-1-5s-1]|uniref:methionyl-tRNA formyltransferase n=1 Tax=Jeotgalibacillus sp. R-1-5s-1 TaxID=2555897 RepID=UPI00106905FF|nr:methionyl-tRNA formyltransferase [Jeotgalibacillus sp. R-1-5s-1]TFD93669.1 methionyl-tRNA formyltransferase [Jeotgalibacillus sp. R-1-5s-1]